VLQLIHFAGYYRTLNAQKKKEKATDTAMNNLHQWIVSNDRSVMQSLDKMHDLTQSLYLRIRMIDLSLRNNSHDEQQGYGQDLHDIISESTHKEAIEKIRSEDLHYYYSTLIGELKHLNRQMDKNAPRADVVLGTGSVSASKNEKEGSPGRWYNRANKVV
jgi:hypothetical protein